ncbi:MAG: SIR2 family protein [Nitrospirae bacterium]|nr:SIR2 family protein [Nitrospirota bacterium]
MKIEDAIKLVIDGRGLLFTGAGFSYGALSISNKSIPSGVQLSKMLITASGLSSQADLDRASAAFLRKRTPDELVSLLKDNYTVKNIAESHKILAHLKWKRVYTTNYDTVFEYASKAIGRSTRSVTAKDYPHGLVSFQNLVVHINGSVDTLSKDELSKSFKLTSASYAAESFEESGWAFHFRNDVRNSAVIVFVGYSLYDIDIARVLLAENVIDKAIFIIAPPSAETELEALELNDFGEVFRIGVEAFAHLVRDVSKSYKPIIINESILAQINAPAANDYVVRRQPLSKIKNMLLNNKKHVILHGVLGCGKSFIVDAFGLMAYGAGWSVYTLRAEGGEEIGETEEILKTGDKIILIIESYHRHMRLIKWVIDAKKDNVILLLTARTDVHEIFAPEIYEKLKSSCVEVDCTKLTNEEIRDAVSLLDKYGLWGKHLSWPTERKISYIEAKCGQELPSLLVDVLKSGHITKKYREIIYDASEPKEIQRILICLFVLEVMNHYPSYSHIQELLGGKNIRWSYIKLYQGLKSIVDFSTNQVKARSAVLGLHLLHTLFQPKFLVETLIQMAKEADDRATEREYKEILKNLMRFKHIALMLPEKQRLQTTITFYEGIKNLHFTNKDPQFWLQYGIASLTLEQLDRAEKYFEDAYSLARAIKGYDCYQIDNHYARLLLAKALLDDSKDSSLALLDKAKKIILPQMHKEDRHYPFRAALGIFKVFNKWKQELAPDQIKIFAGIFSEIEKRHLAASPMIRNNRYVIECGEIVKEKLSSMGLFQNTGL